MIIVRTPLRASLVGGGTDLPQFYSKESGAVISMAIKKYIYIIIHKSFDNKNRIFYNEKEVTNNVDEIQNTRIKAAMELIGVTKGVEIHSIGEVPAGTGLGSSSSFTVGLLNALYAFQEKIVSADYLAKQACKIEIEILKEPIGKQDQYAAAFGGFNKIEFSSDGQVSVRPVIIDKKKIKEIESHLIMFYLGGTRSATEILRNQTKNLQVNEEIFRNQKKMKELVSDMEKVLFEGKISKIGKLLEDNWMLKKTLAKGITNQKIEEYYKIAIENGAKGGKILGAGENGFLLFFIDPLNQERVRNALKGLKEEPVEIDWEGSKIIYFDK
jgi:D-glycero-alpha-D-manno-heptose-7-phosphate kinase